MNTIHGVKQQLHRVATEAAEKGVISPRDLEELLTRPVNRATLEWAQTLVSENRVVPQAFAGPVAPGTEQKMLGDHDKWTIATKLVDAIASVSTAETQAAMTEWKRAQGFR